MIIDLGAFGEFITSHQFIGGIAISIPILSVVMAILYRMVRSIPVLKSFMQFIGLSLAFTVVILAPFIFISAFTEVPRAKLIVIFFVIIIHCIIFFLFNTKTTIKFLKAFSKFSNR